MKKSHLRFEHYLDQLQALLSRSARQKNPALWLYQNNARTPLFMLEGLAKLYGGMHNRKKFGKLKSHFKLLEDAIGQIDHYDSFAKEFALDKKIPAAITNYLRAQSSGKIQRLNELLMEKDWLGNGNTRINKIKKQLKKTDWKNEKEDIKNIRKFYIRAINKILEFINQKDFHFTNVENDVHEFRRMIRWLSIYPQALMGAVQLSKSKTATVNYLAKYLTKAITGSPYNVMPDAGDLSYFLILKKNRFYALSWMIAELGNLKDNGLKVEVIKEALLRSTLTNEKDALANAYKFCSKSQLTIDQVLKTSGDLCKNYCKEKNLELLITGIGTVKN